MVRSRILHNERGAALIITVMAMVLMLTIIVEFAYHTRVDVSMVSNYRNAQQGRYFAEVGIEAAGILLLSDLERDQADGQMIDYYAYDMSGGDNGQNGGMGGMGGMAGFADMMGPQLAQGGLEEIWSLMRPETPAIPLADTGAMVKLTIEDEASKVNLNQLDIPRGLEMDSPLAQRFINFFIACGLDESEARQLIPALLDWIDRDDDVTSGGAESQHYQRLDPPYMTRNRPLVSLEELRLVEGMTPEIWGKISPYVTVFPREQAGLSKINLNTASAPVLQFLHPDLDETAAQALIEERSLEPFTSMSEVQQVLSAYAAGDIFNDILGSIDLRSDHFSVRSSAVVNGVEYTVYAILKRDRNQREIQPLYWRSE